MIQFLYQEAKTLRAYIENVHYDPMNSNPGHNLKGVVYEYIYIKCHLMLFYKINEVPHSL